MGGIGGSDTPINAIAPERRDMPENFDPEAADKRFSEPKGLTDNRLFSEELNDESERLNRLETNVQRMRDDIDEVLPSIRNLVAIEGEIEDLVGQLKTLLSEPPQIANIDTQFEADEQDINLPTSEPPTDLTPPEPQDMAQAPPPEPDIAQIPPDPVAESTPPQNTPTKFAPPTNDSTAVIRNLRVADHPNKTRIVIDSARKITADIDFDSNEKLIIINTDAQSLGFDPIAAGKKSKNIDDISIVETKSGHEIIILMKKGASISAPTFIKPNNDASSHRMYFDVMY
ncbi:MAG: hypothetical protein ACRBCT_02365 [Alphaproteobacteria bacterium]